MPIVAGIKPAADELTVSSASPVPTCGNWFAGRILERMDAGDHEAILLGPFEASSDTGEQPFAFHRASRMEPGHRA